jgi:hypothetical protein
LDDTNLKNYNTMNNKSKGGQEKVAGRGSEDVRGMAKQKAEGGMVGGQA